MFNAASRNSCRLFRAFLIAFILAASFVGAAANARAEGLPGADPGADGTIDLEAMRADGYEGPLDLSGRTVALAPGTLAPTLLSAASTTIGWRAGFHRPSFDGSIQTMAIFQGNLYVGGSFDYMGDLYVGHLARWDGVSWTGVPIASAYSSVRDLVVHEEQLVVGGVFGLSDHDGIWCRNVARYDGSAWTALGNGLSDEVYALAVGPQGQLVAGGKFWYSGSTVVRNVSYWSGTEWLPFASGVDYAVFAIANYDGQIIIGGKFTSDNLGSPLGGIARWTGTAWRGISVDTATTDGFVQSLAVHEGDLYAGGTFTKIDGVGIKRLARWDGTSWSPVPFAPGMTINVTMLKSTPSALIISGTEQEDGAVWDSIDDGIMTLLYDVALYGEDWLVSGFFPTIAASPYLAFLDGGGLSAGPGYTNGVGLDAGVSALTVHGDEVVVSGEFQTAGSTIATRLAAWNGSTWREIGGGLPSTARVLASYGDDLVVGGGFLTIGDLTVNRIARWDGTQWFALGDGLSNTPNAIVQYGDDLIAAGSFSLAGGTAVANIARWDGSQWHALGTGLNGMARTLIVHDGLLIVGGSFTTAGGVAAAYLAAWDGAAWSQFGGGANADVYALADLEGNLVAGGYFGQIGGVAASRIARLRAGLWEPLGTGFVGEYCWVDLDGYHCDPRGVERLATIGGELYASGTVTQAGAVAVHGLARWDDWNHWMALDSGISGTIWGMSGLDGALYVGGSFSLAGDKRSANVAVWDEPAALPAEGDRWWAGFDGNGPDGPSYAVGTYGDALVVAGMFGHLGSFDAGSIGTWDGTAWHALGSGLAVAGSNMPQVHATLEYQGDLYATGLFSVPPSTVTCDLARWNGTAWEALGLSGDLARGRTLAIFNDHLIVGGGFQTMGGQPAANIVAWDGSSFSPLGSGLNGGVTALTVHEGKLVVGGSFTSAGGLPVRNLALWNGSAWETPPPGFETDKSVWTLLSHGEDLYVGGEFSTAGGAPARAIARWDGSAFHPLGAGIGIDDVYSRVNCLSWLEDRLVAGGNFSGTPLNNLATWDGTSWSSLGGGTSDEVWSTCLWKGDFFVGGDFFTAGGKNSPRIARWISSPTGVTGQPPAAPVRLDAVYPNPFNPATRIRFSLARPGPARVTVYDLRGRLIRTLANGSFTAGEHTLLWNGQDTEGRSVGTGVYFVRVQAMGEAVVRKVTLLK